MDKKKLLLQIDFFKSLPEKALSNLSDKAQEIYLKKDEVLFTEGQLSDALYIVFSGRTQASKKHNSIEVPISQLTKGGVIGLTSLISLEHNKRSATVKATEDSCLICINKEDFLEAFFGSDQTKVNLSRHLSSFLVKKLRAKNQKVAELTPHDQNDSLKIAFFDSKNYFVKAFNKRIQEKNDTHVNFLYLETRLSSDTVNLAIGCKAICVFVNDDLSKNVLTQLQRIGVEIIAMRCAGVNNLNLEIARSLNMDIVSVPSYSPYAVAEHALALLMTLNRKVHKASNRIREGNFSIEKLVGFDLNGKTVGVIGTGQIGLCFIKIAKGLGCNILAHDPYEKEKLAKEIGFKYTDLTTLFKESRVISLHAPLTSETHHLINQKAFDFMPKGTILLNTSRGGLVDTKALINALKRGHLGGAGLDVYEEEQGYFYEDLSAEILTDEALVQLMTFPNVIITSHQAFLTEEALDNIAQTTLQSLTQYQEGKRGQALTFNVIKHE